MQLARFSLRSAFWITTLAAFVFLITSLGAFGQALWTVLLAGLSSLAACLLMHAAFYAACLALARLVGSDEVVARSSRGGLVGHASTGDRPPTAARATWAEDP